MRAAWLVLLFACSAEENVAVDLTIAADPCTQDVISRLVVVVSSYEGEELDRFEASEGLSFPTGVRVESSDPEARWQVDVHGFNDDGVEISTQHAEGGFAASVSNRAVLLDDRCLGIECPGSTCVAGRCETVALEAVTANARPLECPTFVHANASGSELPCGSFDAPCRDLTDALGQIGQSGGVMLLAGDAPFTSPLGPNGHVLTIDKDNVVVRPMTPDDSPVIDASGVRSALFLKAEHLTIYGLEIRGARRNGLNINGLENRSVTVRGCNIHSNGDSWDGEGDDFDNHGGVLLNNGTFDVLIEDNWIHDNVNTTGFRGSGVHINNAVALVRNNVIERNGIGIFTNVDDGTDGSTVITDNTIRFNENFGLRIDYRGETHGNRVCGNGEHGIIGSHDATIEFNTVVNNGGTGIRLVQDDYVVRHNVVMGNGLGIDTMDVGMTIIGPNLYFENERQFGDATSDTPEEDLLVDPLVVDADACDVTFQGASPALGDTDADRFGAPQ